MAKTIFNRFFHAKADTGEMDTSPAPDPLHPLREHMRRSLAEWIARRLGQLTANPGDREDELLHAASVFIRWLEEGRDVYIGIKECKFAGDVHQRLLQVYGEIAGDLPVFFPEKRPQSVPQPGEDAMWEIYRDVMYAATQRKFLLIRKSEVDAYKAGRLLCEAVVNERQDITTARDLAKQTLQNHGVSAAALMNQLLVISEGVTNILKHARAGRLVLIAADNAIHAIVEDSGPGFPLKLLPNAALMAGYSTKKSLGQGFTLMMKMASQVVLSTVPDEGSTLILVFSGKEEVQQHGSAKQYSN